MVKILKKTSHRDSNEEYIVEDLMIMHDYDIHRTCIMYSLLRDYQLPPEIICSSSKLAKFDEVLPVMKKKGDRVLLFSQFVIVLNILEEYMKIRGYKYLRLDGSTPVHIR